MTQQAQIIQGSIVAIVTPMFEDGSVDWKGLEKLVEWVRILVYSKVNIIEQN